MQVKNWAKFQHFKDRRPPWVKLYRDILDDIEWHKLDGDSAKMLINIWLIASEYSGEVPDIATLAFRLRITEIQVKKALSSLGHWLISERYQDDISVIQKISATDIEVPLRERDREREETEEEIEKEAKKEKTARGSRLPQNFELDFQFAVDQGLQNTLEEAAKFRDYWNSQPGQKGVKLDWQATWRNWCRNAKPSAKVQQSSETPYQRSMREKYQTIAPSIAAHNPNAPRIDVNTFFDTLPAKKLEITNG
jgi:hypothetical protein